LIKKLLAAIAIATITALLSACFSPWQGDEETLTIFVGGGSSRVLVDIEENEQTSSGSLIQVTGGKLEMYDGVILQNNSCNRPPGGGGVYICMYGNFTMYGGIIRNNKVIVSEATNIGGGVCLNIGTFTMYNGNINGNEANNGGGVSVYGGTFNMTGGSISENKGLVAGGGIYLTVGYDDSEGVFTMSGGRIYDNTLGNNGGDGKSMNGVPNTIITIFGDTKDTSTSSFIENQNIPY